MNRCLAKLNMLPIQAVTDSCVAETFERLVIAKHRLSRIYCCPEKVKFEFLDRWKRKAWSDKEDRDDIAFFGMIMIAEMEAGADITVYM